MLKVKEEDDGGRMNRFSSWLMILDSYFLERTTNRLDKPFLFRIFADSSIVFFSSFAKTDQCVNFTLIFNI